MPPKEPFLHACGRDRIYETEFVVVYTTTGRPIRTLQRKMVMIPDRFPDAVGYLYGSKTDAERADHQGGTAFIIYRVVATTNHRFYYAVTNQHVIDDGFSVLRMNRLDGGSPDIIDLRGKWFPHRGGADVAAAFIDDSDANSFEGFNSFYLLTREFIEKNPGCLRLGNEIYMLGRFGGSPGIKHNRPVVRSGIISQMPNPDEPIEIRDDIAPQEAYLMEMHSISGFSGSPVFHNLESLVQFTQMRPIMEALYELPVKNEIGASDESPILVGGSGCRRFFFMDEDSDSRRFNDTQVSI